MHFAIAIMFSRGKQSPDFPCIRVAFVPTRIHRPGSGVFLASPSRIQALGGIEFAGRKRLISAATKWGATWSARLSNGESVTTGLLAGRHACQAVC